MEKIPLNWRSGSRQEQIAYQAVKDRNKGDGPDLGLLWGSLNKKERKRYMEFFDSKIEIEFSDSKIK